MSTLTCRCASLLAVLEAAHGLYETLWFAADAALDHLKGIRAVASDAAVASVALTCVDGYVYL